MPPPQVKTKPTAALTLTVSWNKITPTSTMGIWCKFINTAVATADVSWTTFNSETVIKTMPIEMKGMINIIPDDNNNSGHNAHLSKNAARPKHTRPVMGCARYANCSFDILPRADPGLDFWVMIWISDHFTAVKSIEQSMKVRPLAWLSARSCSTADSSGKCTSKCVPATFSPPESPLLVTSSVTPPMESRHCRKPPPTSRSPATTRSAVMYSNLHSRAAAIMRSTFMFCSIVRSDTAKPSRDLFKHPNSQPAMSPRPTTRVSSPFVIFGSGPSRSTTFDKTNEMMPHVVLTRNVSVKNGMEYLVDFLNMAVT
mmetsp:Transcript_56099/g.145898  ORF Transcript_56099/g.145898 Transcript_56099/m.145898 type:complete len:313 (-) Transcript_56099:1008-1946(-)